MPNLSVVEIGLIISFIRSISFPFSIGFRIRHLASNEENISSYAPKR